MTCFVPNLIPICSQSHGLMGEPVKQLKTIEDISWYENVNHANFDNHVLCLIFYKVIAKMSNILGNS